jgi:hypothetical protein
MRWYNLSLPKIPCGSSAVKRSRPANPETSFHMPNRPIYPFEQARENGRHLLKSRFLTKCWAKMMTWDQATRR